jgi:hypothetical protein
MSFFVSNTKKSGGTGEIGLACKGCMSPRTFYWKKESLIIFITASVIPWINYF